MDEDSSHIDRLTRWVLFDIVHNSICVFDTSSYKKKRYTKKKYGYHREVCTYTVAADILCCVIILEYKYAS